MKNGDTMNKNKIWISILILGICSVLTGLPHLFYQRYGFAVWQILLGTIQIILAFVQKKIDDKKHSDHKAEDQ